MDRKARLDRPRRTRLRGRARRGRAANSDTATSVRHTDSAPSSRGELTSIVATFLPLRHRRDARATNAQAALAATADKIARTYQCTFRTKSSPRPRCALRYQGISLAPD